jgi:actin-like ATPase involved in cell morphogenesis
VRVLSVDLGTSNTVAVLSAHGRPPRVVEVDGSATMPSAIFASEDGGGLVVGRDAERRARLDPSRFEPNPKRRIDEGTLLLGDTVVPVTDALAAVLRRVIEETSRQLGGDRPDEVRLTHPAQWGPVRRNVLLSAARQAGMGSNLVLVPEPVAAAAHFASFPGQGLAPGQALAVYDLGAGTFDVAVVAATQAGFAVFAETGLPDLGGMDVDHALLEHVGRQVSQRDPARWQRLLRPASIGDRRARRALGEDVKAAKESLSRHPQIEVPMPEAFEDVLVTRVELEALIRPSLLRSVELLAGTIRTTGLSPGRLRGIYLVGGSSRIPLVATLIAEGLRVVPTSLDQPETAVALGAHHVTQEGVSLRTRKLGPVPVSPPPVRQQFVPPPPPPLVVVPKSGAGKKILIGVAAAVVVALGVVAGVLILSGGDQLPTAAECRQKDGKDGAGFTACLRQLAGGVPDHNQCKAGDGTTVVDVSCTLPDDYRVSYAHAGTQDDVARVIDNQLDNLTQSVTVEADWKGNGLQGRYRAAAGGGTGVLVFTVKDRPLVGWITKTEARDITPDTLADFFAGRVQPGT